MIAMTLLGKTFTVFILVMSVLFMGFAIMVFSTHRNWKLLADNPTPTAEYPLGLKQQYEQLSQLNKQLRDEIDRAGKSLALEQAARRSALAALQEQKSQSETARAQAEAQLANLQAAHTQAVATLQATQARLDALTTEVVAVRDELRTTQQDRDAQFALAVEKTDNLNDLQGVKRDLQERHDQLLYQLSRAKKVLESVGLTEHTPTDGIPPEVDGYVVAVGDKDLVEISIGSDDGLRVGHQLHVYRDRSYLGKVVVRKTLPDKSVVEILKQYRQGLIKKGDSVATKLI
jgi:predicted  nucleic acid-binding Zn-ribbon protein